MTQGADPLLAWDGGRHLAFAVAARPGLRLALFAHTAGAQEMTALWEAEAGTCAAALPEGCRHLELHMLDGATETAVVAIELDDLLLPDLVAQGLPGLSRVVCSPGGELARGDGPPPDGSMVGLVMGQPGEGAFSRRRIGPLFDPSGGGRRIGVRAEGEGAGIALVLNPPGEALPLVAHVIAASRREGALKDIGRYGDAPDALGARPAVYLQRGFRLLAPQRGPDGAARVDIAPFDAGDEAIVLAPRGWIVAWDEGAEPGGSRLFLSRGEDGDWRARAVSSAYRPASATAMAALGGGLPALYAGGATATVSEADMAADLAAAIWRRTGASVAPTPQTPLPAAAALPPREHFPMARLTRLGAGGPEGLSPFIAGLGPGCGVAAPALEEIDGLPAQERLALALWFAKDPALALQAVAARILLPPPSGAPADIAALLAWCADVGQPQRLERAARLTGPGRQEDKALLRRAAERLGMDWLPLAEAAAAERLLAREAGPAEAADGPALRLLAGLRDDRAALAAALAESRGLALAAIAERRSGLPAAAAAAGLPAALAADLGLRLADFEAADILLLHRHIESAALRQRAVAAVREAVDALDAAAGNGGLARRVDRSGDPLVGMTRLGSSAEAAVRALTRLPAAREALVALSAFVDRHAADVPGDTLLGDLRRNLTRYGCLLLAQAVATECAAALPGAPWSERLLSGAVETLPALARAAAEALPEDAALGLTFAGGLAAR